MVNVLFLNLLQFLLIPQLVALQTLLGMETNASAIMVSTLSMEAVPSVLPIVNGDNGKGSVHAGKAFK